MNDKEKAPKSPHSNLPSSAKSGDASWASIQRELKDALDTWCDLAASAPRACPEDEKIQKVKRLLTELQEKIREF